MKSINFRSGCPISSVLDIMGDKWTMLIVRDIAMFGKHTFNEFLQSEEKIASNILSDRLNRLEKSKLIIKKKHPESKAKIYYDLAEMGKDLIPILFEMAIWSDKYIKINQDAKLLVESIKKDKSAALERILKGDSLG